MKMKMKIMIAGVVLLSATFAQAQNWIAGDGDWSTDASWSSGVQPTTGLANLYNGSTVTVTQSGEICGGFRLGNTAANVGVLHVNSGDLTSSATPHVGFNGTGTLLVAGGTFTSTGGTIANGSTASGSATVSGSGSWAVSSGTMYIGQAGTGSLTVNNGGTASAGSTYIANATTGNGTLTVTGSGSTWTSSSSVQIGASGTGSLTVSDGGFASMAGVTYIGANAGGSGTVAITGDDSILRVYNSLRVGWTGTGTLTVEDGGTLIADSLSVDPSTTGSYLNMGVGGAVAILDTADEGSADINAFLSVVLGNDDIRYWNGSAFSHITTGVPGVDYTLSHETSGDLAGYTTLAVIPEPGTMGLLIMASAGLLVARRVRVR